MLTCVFINTPRIIQLVRTGLKIMRYVALTGVPRRSILKSCGAKALFAPELIFFLLLTTQAMKHVSRFEVLCLYLSRPATMSDPYGVCVANTYCDRAEPC